MDVYTLNRDSASTLLINVVYRMSTDNGSVMEPCYVYLKGWKTGEEAVRPAMDP